MQLQDIKHLAALARLEITDEEGEGLLHDLEATLAYVDQVTGVEVSDTNANYLSITNAFREDAVTNPTGAQSETLLAEVPMTQDGFVKVKKIL